MTATISKTQRWLDLIALLLGRRIPLSVEEIMERMPAYGVTEASDEKARATARRKFERDKDELRAAGIPIDTVRYEINYGLEIIEGYRIARKDFYLPYLRLLSEGDAPRPAPPAASLAPTFDIAPTEAAPAFDALRRVAEMPDFPFPDDARSALRKLAFDIDADHFDAAPVVWVDRPGVQAVLGTLRLLSDALLARKRVEFQYAGIERGTTTDRDVAPYGLFYNRDWYLVGHDATREAVRVFRVARISELRVNSRSPRTPDYQIPDGFSIDEYIGRSAWELGDEGDSMEVDVRFSFPRSIGAARGGEGELVAHGPDGSSLRRFTVRQPDPFLRWILAMRGKAEIVAPRQMGEALREMARAVAANHAGEGERDG